MNIEMNRVIHAPGPNRVQRRRMAHRRGLSNFPELTGCGMVRGKGKHTERAVTCCRKGCAPPMGSLKQAIEKELE